MVGGFTSGFAMGYPECTNLSIIFCGLHIQYRLYIINIIYIYIYTEYLYHYHPLSIISWRSNLCHSPRSLSEMRFAPRGRGSKLIIQLFRSGPVRLVRLVPISHPVPTAFSAKPIRRCGPSASPKKIGVSLQSLGVTTDSVLGVLFSKDFRWTHIHLMNLFEYRRSVTFATIGSVAWPPWVILLATPFKIFRMQA